LGVTKNVTLVSHSQAGEIANLKQIEDRVATQR
jgi:hypothetical protein